MRDYLVEEESLHGNFCELKKMQKNTKKMQKTNANKNMQIRKKLQQNAKKRKTQQKCKTNAKKTDHQKKCKNKSGKYAKKMRPNQSSKNKKQNQKEKKGKKRDSPLNRLEAPPKIAALLSPRQNLSLSKICPLAKFVLKQKFSFSKICP